MIKCEMCGRVKEDKKRFQRHHISYEKGITILLCYTCHSYVHGRSFVRMRNQWELKHGKDKGFIMFAIKFLELCTKHMEDYKQKS